MSKNWWSGVRIPRSAPLFVVKMVAELEKCTLSAPFFLLVSPILHQLLIFAAISLQIPIDISICKITANVGFYYFGYSGLPCV